MTMQLSLAGLWQLSPLTDVSIPQGDITFPAPLSRVLPSYLAEDEIARQEWHLMHDVEIEAHHLSFPAIDLVLEGIDYFAEVRLNGVALFDCDGTLPVYKKNIRPLLNPGRNRVEILFLEQDDDWLIEHEHPDQCGLCHSPAQRYDERLGIWRAPYLQLIRHVRLEHVATEQIWHYSGGCELLVRLFFTTYSPGLVSAAVRFDGMTYHLPIDMRSDSASALFQVEAPKYYDAEHPNPANLYQLDVELDGQKQAFHLALSDDLCVTHFPL